MAPTNGARAVEVAVVGAGAVGLASAYELAQRGLRVTIVERTTIGADASGLQPGGGRQQCSSRVDGLVARGSLAVYRELGERLGTRLCPSRLRPGRFDAAAPVAETQII